MTSSHITHVIAAFVTCLAAVAVARSQEPARAAAAAAPQADTSQVTARVIDAGRRIFHGKGTCFACHGMNLEGGPVAPPLRAHQWKDARGGELNAILYVDTHGVAGTIMVAHPGGISDSEAIDVASYIWAVNHRGVKP